MTRGAEGGAASDAARHAAAPFVPRRGRTVAIWVGAAALVVFGLLGLFLPGGEKWGLGDRLSVAAIGVLIAALMSRYATIRAVPHEKGLWIRNLAGPEVIAWELVESVRFGQGMPWVRLELADGDEIAVMAIQRSDGPRAIAEAQRLADLVGRTRHQG